MTDQAGEIDVFETVGPIWCFERMPIETCLLHIHRKADSQWKSMENDTAGTNTDNGEQSSSRTHKKDF